MKEKYFKIKEITKIELGDSDIVYALKHSFPHHSFEVTELPSPKAEVWCCCGSKGIKEDPFKDGLQRRCYVCEKLIKPIRPAAEPIKPIELPTHTADIASKLNEVIERLNHFLKSKGEK